MEKDEKKSQQKLDFLQSFPLYYIFYVTTIFTLLITFGYSTYFLLIDPDPPEMPVSQHEIPIDCTRIHLRSILPQNSRISMEFTVDDFLQYPQSSAMSMLKVIISSANSQSSYIYTNFWDQQSNLSHIFFNILHPIQGENMDLEVKCGALSLGHWPVSVNSVPVYPVGWSILLSQDTSYVKIVDGCFNNNSFVICTPPHSNFKPFHLSDDISVNVINTQSPAATYASINNISMLKNENNNMLDSIFIGANSKLSYEKITDVLIPLWGLIHDKQDFTNDSTIVLFNENNDLVQFLKPIFNGEIKKSTDTNQCFSNGVVLASSTSPAYNLNMHEFQDQTTGPLLSEAFHYDHITHINQKNIKTLREKFNSLLDNQPKQGNRKHIVLDHGSRILLSTLEKLYPKAKFEVISDADPLNLISNILSKADVFITSNIRTAAYSIFMNPGKKIVELPPTGLGCFRACERWASLLKLRYYSLSDQKDICLAKTLLDYLKLLESAQYPLLTENFLRKVLNPVIL